ncbi:hypothetical protein BH09BAC2_BH09BAC2_02640 [soil metagenome]
MFCNSTIFRKPIWIKYLLFLLMVTTAASCGRLDVYEKTLRMPNQQWDYNNSPEFTFNISDTTSFYNIYFVVRHTDAYKYNNLWVNLQMKFPGDSTVSKKIEITLASDAKGWYGKGMDDIYELRQNISGRPVSFKRAGTCAFKISQLMRENPVQHILNAGVRVERINAR